MPSTVLLVVHQETSDPGFVGAALRGMGCALDIRIPTIGHQLPSTMEHHDGAVIFGGPMSANDDTKLPFIRQELDWIPTVLEAEKPFLGVCLGGQLLARVLGAKVAPHPDGMKEIGYFEVSPTRAGGPIFGAPMHFYQWHNEGFEVPCGAELLATGEMFFNQCYCYNGAAYGVQFHPEATPEIVERWSRIAGHRLSGPGAQSREQQLAEAPAHLPVIGDWVERFMRHWLKRTPERELSAVPG